MCNDYRPGVYLKNLPCQGCDFCTRARQQWETFEEEVDFVVQLTIRTLTPESNTNVQGNSWINPYSSEDLQNKQMKDQDLRLLISWIKQKYTPSKQELQLSNRTVRHFWMCNTQLQLRNGILYYKWEDPVNPRLLLLVPKQMQKEVLYGCHDIRMAGHLGQYKTLEKLKEAVIWHGMTQDCILYVKSCSTCNKNKKKNKNKSETGIISFWCSYGKGPYGHSWTSSNHQKRKQSTC